MDGLRKVVFHFGVDLKERYLARVPDRGDLVTHGPALWIVRYVRVDASGATIICQQPDDHDGHLRRVA